MSERCTGSAAFPMAARLVLARADACVCVCQCIFVSSAHFFFFFWKRGAYAQGSDGARGLERAPASLAAVLIAAGAGRRSPENTDFPGTVTPESMLFASVLWPGGSKSSRCDIMLQRCLLLFPPWPFSLPLPHLPRSSTA